MENFDYMIGHTNIPQTADLEKACRKAFGKPPLLVFELGVSFPPTPAPTRWLWYTPDTPEGNTRF